MEENRFIDSFRAFIRTCGVPFTEQQNVFLFPEQKLQIRLVPGENLFGPDGADPSRFQVSGSPASSLEHPPLLLPDTLYLYEDRWFFAPEVTRERIAARLGRFKSIFARKCKVLNSREWQQLEKERPHGEIDSETHFLNSYHAYGAATSKYRYALLWEDRIVAVATFSAPRPMLRQLSAPLQNISPQQAARLQITDRPLSPGSLYGPNEAAVFRSYEWVRYASLPGVRVAGGMGKLLQAFLKEVEHPDNPRFAGMPIEVMSYSDNEWSGGEVYETLGFTLAGERDAVEYYVDRTTYERLSIRKLGKLYRSDGDHYRITNRGSRKYLLQPALITQSSHLPIASRP